MNQDYATTAINGFRQGLSLVTEIQEAPERKRREQEMYEIRKRGAELGIERAEGGLADAEHARNRRKTTEAQADELHGLRIGEYGQKAKYAAEDRQTAKAERARRHRREDGDDEYTRWRRSQQKLVAKREKEINEIQSVLPIVDRVRSGQRVSDDEINRVRESFGALDLDYDALADPEVFEHAKAFEELKQTGAVTQSTMDAVNYFFKPAIDRNIGKKGEDGTPIVSSRIVSAGYKRADDHTPSDETGIVWKLEVKTKGGKTYLAPITVNRTAEGDDPVRVTSIRDLANHVQGRLLIARALQGEDAYRALTAEAAKRGAASAATGKESANVQYAKDVAQAKFDGDQGAALDWIKQSKGKSPHEMAIELTKIDLNRNKFGNVTAADKQRLYQENLAIAQQMVGASGQRGNPAAGDGQAPPLSADPDAILDELIGGGA